jgi:hypothetical protein
MRQTLAFPLGFLCCATLLSATQILWAQPGTKKLIEYGWDVPAPSFVAQNIRQMENRPFDGLILRVPTIGTIFTGKKWDPADPKIAAELKALEQIQWGKFTDNFVIMYAASTMDWFSDADWESVQSNVRLCAQAAKAGRCKGVCFDPEPYGNNPWLYGKQAHAGEKTFAEYEAQVRKRGAQFMTAIQEVMPNAVVHTFFQLGYLTGLLSEPDPEARERKLSQHPYGLLPAFVNGMLDVALPTITITDGNESSYYYTEPLSYYRAFLNIRQTALGLVAPENRRKYLAQMQCAQALYVDYVFDYWGRATPAKYMTPEERAQWFQHNVYWALTTADEYVWLYSERMDWWQNKNLPPGLEQAVISAREKVAKRQPLGFEMTDIIKAAKERERAELQKKLEQKAADIPHLAQGQAPVIDGRLSDEAWRAAAELGPFVPYATVADDSLKAKTVALAAWDEKALYLGVRCEEPNMKGLRIEGQRVDDDVWLGDSVDVFLTAEAARQPFYHLIVNPLNVRWDALHTDRERLDSGWSPAYNTATERGEAGWTLEMALPWDQLKIVPAPGVKLYANICRQRCAGGSNEYSAWSRCVQGFIEPDRFGTWTLR